MDNPSLVPQTEQLLQCERNGFPILEINGGARPLAGYGEACIWNQKVSAVVPLDDTLYRVYENSLELPLLCYCYGEALGCPYLQSAQMD